MPPKKKKSGGDATKGERIFKNLCAACHSLSVLKIIFQLNLFIGSFNRSRTRRSTRLEYCSRRRIQLFICFSC